MPASADDLAVLKQARPYIRSVCAFLLYLRFGPGNKTEACYERADEFLAQLKRDMNSDS